MRTLVIGDIHGGLRALEQLLDRAGTSKDDRLIFLGDYVDGWSQAVETVNFLIGLRQRQDCIFLRGNHDELCYDWLSTWKDNPLWFQHGGEATMDSYLGVAESIRQTHMEFFKSLENYYLDKEDVCLSMRDLQI